MGGRQMIRRCRLRLGRLPRRLSRSLRTAGDQLIVANSQLNRRSDGNPELPFSIIAIPLSELE